MIIYFKAKRHQKHADFCFNCKSNYDDQLFLSLSNSCVSCYSYFQVRLLVIDAAVRLTGN